MRPRMSLATHRGVTSQRALSPWARCACARARCTHPPPLARARQGVPRPAMFQIRQDPRKAAKELNSNLLLFGTIVVVSRLSSYILDLAQRAGA